VPTPARLDSLAALTPVLRLRGGGEVVLRLRPYDAPTNTDRFVRLAANGYFDGLTFHRVVPNFAVQGGSPGANEYWGDGPFTRDELTVAPHRRGTMGVSTRGRDTGDGQIFVNLVDNWRLDHNYTIFADVVEGMDVIDAMLEGATIERIEFR
jgi:cyclophilin family peptidyl-prolyl cis-trans isomerase